MHEVMLRNRSKKKKLNLPFGHGEVCSPLGKCLCTIHGKGGQFRFRIGESKVLPIVVLRARSVRSALRKQALEKKVLEEPKGERPGPAQEEKGGSRKKKKDSDERNGKSEKD